MNQLEVIQLRGLYLQPNSLAVPPGACEQALNVVCSYDNIIKKRRGYYTWNTPSATPTALFNYKNSIISLMASKIATVSSNGTETAYTGSVSTSGMYPRSVQSNENLYFTTNNGVLKLETLTPGSVYKSGIPPALDCNGYMTLDAGGVKGDSQVAYRIVFGRRDANKNLLLGTPSERCVVIGHGGGSEFAISLEFSIPSEINSTDYFYQIYRTKYSANASTDPGSEYLLVDETQLTLQNILDGFVVYLDEVPESLLGAYLYTNINTGEGELQSNDRPPYCKDVALYKNYVFYANTKSRHNLEIDVIDPTVLASGYVIAFSSVSSSASKAGTTITVTATGHGLVTGNYIYITSTTGTGTQPSGFYSITRVDDNTFTFTAAVEPTTISAVFFTYQYYEFRKGLGNTRVRTNSAASTVGATTTVEVTYTNHGFNSNDTVYISGSEGTGTQPPKGTYVITKINANKFSFTYTSTGTPAVNHVVVEGLYGSLLSVPNPFLRLIAFQDTGDLDVDIEYTAKSIVKAVNRNPYSTIYGRYISGAASDIPGKMVFVAKDFGVQFYAYTLNSNASTAFTPYLPTVLATVVYSTVVSDNDTLANGLYFSKYGEPEAVPISNFMLVGAENSPIVRIATLRDSLIIFKEDGIYRVNGEVAPFSVTILDNTAIIKAENSLAVLNNKVYAMTTAGIVEVSDTSAVIQSRRIEIPVNAVLGHPNLNTETYGIAYESERTYMLTTIAPNQSTATVVYVFNYLTQEWTTWDTYFKGGVIGPSDTMYYISTTNKIFKERKEQRKTDFTGEAYTVTVASVSSDTKTVVFSGTTYIPEAGDIVVKADRINRVKTAVVGVSSVTCEFTTLTNLAPADTPTLYKRIRSYVMFAPITGGAPTRNKHYSQFQAMFRSPSCSRLKISFANEKFGGSELVEWNNYDTFAFGWGNPAWGFFPWGEGELVNSDYTTLPNMIARTYVPKFAARGTYLQPTLEHVEAGEEFILQGVGLAARVYSERTNK